LPVTTVLPFGEEVVAIDSETGEFSKLSHKYSGEIERAKLGNDVGRMSGTRPKFDPL
jgi:hypothetical protein